MKVPNQYCAGQRQPMRSTHGDLVGNTVALLLREAVEGGAELRDQGREARCEGVGAGEFEVDVDAVEAVVLDQLHSAGNEGGTLPGVGDEVEVS